MQTSKLTAHWAVAMITDPSRANAAGKIHRRRAWYALMTARGHYCRYPGFPEPKRTEDNTRTAA